MVGFLPVNPTRGRLGWRAAYGRAAHKSTQRDLLSK